MSRCRGNAGGDEGQRWPPPPPKPSRRGLGEPRCPEPCLSSPHLGGPDPPGTILFGSKTSLEGWGGWTLGTINYTPRPVLGGGVLPPQPLASLIMEAASPPSLLGGGGRPWAPRFSSLLCSLGWGLGGEGCHLSVRSWQRGGLVLGEHPDSWVSGCVGEGRWGSAESPLCCDTCVCRGSRGGGGVPWWGTVIVATGGAVTGSLEIQGLDGWGDTSVPQCMNVCVHLCVHVLACWRLCAHMCVHVSAYVCTCVCLPAKIRAHVFVGVRIYTPMHCVCTCVCMCTCLYMCGLFACVCLCGGNGFPWQLVLGAWPPLVPVGFPATARGS